MYSMTKTLKKLRAAFYWAQTMHRYSKAEYQDALDSYNRYSRFKKPRSVQLAFYATLQIALGNSHLAKKELGGVINRIRKLPKSKQNDNTRYVELYAKMYLSLIKKTDDHRVYWTEAKELSPKKTLRRWLPLPDKFEFEEN